MSASTWVGMTLRGMIELPSVDGKQVKLSAMSPLATAQKNEEITKFANAYGMGAQLFGPEAMKAKIRDEEAIFLRGSLPVAAVTDAELDRILGSMWAAGPAPAGEQPLENPQEIAEGGPPIP